jgi:hypothetical protein
LFSSAIAEDSRIIFRYTLSTNEILQILSVSLFDKMPLQEFLANVINQDFKEQDFNQLKINLI